MATEEAYPKTEFAVTSLLADSGGKYRFDQLPAEAVTIAKQCLLDWFGVALGGAGEPATAILREEARTAGDGVGNATVVGGDRAPAYWATLINGTASHALDFDDVHAAMGGHPSAPIFPALLAQAEATCLTGRDFIAAFVAGFETQCRIGTLVMPGHYQAGWHATATLGTFGAAAACSHALGLTAREWAYAIGIAGTSASGLKSMFGTMCKPLHAGKAAANGLLAARLAARGFESNPEVLETEQGFFSTHAASLGNSGMIEVSPIEHHIRGVLFKYHAACFFTHASIRGLMELRDEHGLCAEQVQAVLLRVPPNHLSACNISEPATPLEGKFSLKFTAALALSGSDVGESDFTYESVADPALVNIRNKVSVESADHFANNHSCEVFVRLRDNTMLTREVDMEIPEEDLDRQWERLKEKFTALSAPVLGEEKAARLMWTIMALEDSTNVAEVADLCKLGDGR